MQTIALFFLIAVALGGAAWVFIYPILSGERQAEKRKASVARPGPVTRTARGPQKSRREQVEESLKELDTRNRKAKRIPLANRISQAGLTFSKRTFLLGSAGLGILVFLLAFTSGGGLLPSLGFGFAAALGLPRWALAYLKKRRESRFLEVFPDAIDVIVRGIKSGLPLLDCLKIIATDSQDPVKSEFRALVESQTIGLPLGEACSKIHERIPVPEANFFAIVITIQQKAGGNLSRVLRDRKRMKAKIQAMSMEAKASAMIIASLPIAVMLLVYITSPDYISLLWTDPKGQLMLVASATWMSMGVFVMKKMINFDF